MKIIETPGMEIGFEPVQFLLIIIPFLLLLIPLYFIIPAAVRKAIHESRIEKEKIKKEKDV